jgi:tubulin polyglutamylase TTLL6/13
LLDKKLKPWLLEINESPSFNDDTEIDKRVKGGLIETTFRMLDLRKQKKRQIMELTRDKTHS